MIKFKIPVELEKDDSCKGCPARTCGHWGESVYCKLGFGEIKHIYRDKKTHNDMYAARPKKCKEHFKT